MIYTLIALFGATLNTGGVAPRVAGPQVPAGDYMYTFVTTGESGSKSSGTVRVHGARMRIDMDNRKSSDDYILLTDGGTQMMSVHPDEKKVDEISSPSFEHIIGTSLRVVSPLVKFNVQNLQLSSQRVATGQKLLGYATAQVRVTERFDVHIRALGFDAGTEHHTVVTDYWVSPGLDLGSNPLLSLIEHTSTAMAQTDRGFVQQEAAMRAQAVHGTPLRTVVRETTVDDKGAEHSNTHSIEITSVRFGAQPAALFTVPSGYRISSGMNVDM
jgi:hypothetical protein